MPARERGARALRAGRARARPRLCRAPHTSRRVRDAERGARVSGEGGRGAFTGAGACGRARAGVRGPPGPVRRRRWSTGLSVAGHLRMRTRVRVCARIHTQGWACVCPRGHRETGLPHQPQAELRLVGIEHRVGLRPWAGCQPRALLMRTLPAALTASRARPRRPQPMGLGQTRDRTPGFAADGGAAVELRPGRSPGIVIRGLLRPLALPALRSLAPPPHLCTAR